MTTNSITQVFSRRTVSKHLEAKKPISLLMAIPDHPWTKATDDYASVRIAMTVAVAGRRDGVLREVTREAGLNTDEPNIALSAKEGRINADLSVGADVTSALSLLANEGLSSPGVKLHGDGFIVTPSEAAVLGLGKRPGLEKHIRNYRNGRDLMATPRGVMVIDLFGLDADSVRSKYPEVYQHLSETVRTSRKEQFDRSPTRDAGEYLARWWIFGKPREQLRPALIGLTRYIATVETAKHRVFVFFNADILADNKLIVIAADDAFDLGVLSSSVHRQWYFANAGKLGVYKEDAVYVKSRCFDPFPFPDCSDALKDKIRAVAEEM
ncbi:MAG: type IIL restriction-modification enzyme MmeI, partial [Hyphomicrobium sp.]